MYDEPARPLSYVPNTNRQSTAALMASMQHAGIPTARGGYPPSGYLLQQGGHCSESTSYSAPPQWRGGEGQPIHNMNQPPENTLADELAKANAKWQRLDSVATMDWMVDPDTKPQFKEGGEGLPLIEGPSTSSPLTTWTTI